MNLRKTVLALLAGILAGCQLTGTLTTGVESELTVFAAASLTEAFTEIGEAFRSGHPGVEVVFNFAGSQQLVQQLAQGAPADVFASANQAQMEAAVEAGRVETGERRVFAGNELTVILPAENPAGLAQLKDLSKPGIKLVLAAKEVPAGNYALQFLEKANLSPGFGESFMEDVLANVVSYEENIRSVYSKVALGEADAGIVYVSDIPRDNPEGVKSVEIPAELNVLAEYQLAAVSGSVNPDLAKAFVEFVLSSQGQAILASYGFSPAQ